MAGWDGEAEDVGSGAGVAGGYGGGQLADFRSQDAFGGDDAFEFHQFAAVVAARAALQEVAVDQSSGEADAHAHTRLRDFVQFGRDQVVEVTVEVRGRQQRKHPSDRVLHARRPPRQNPLRGRGIRRRLAHAALAGSAADRGTQNIRSTDR
ncbi:hypothetical protein AW168_15005 [Nocardia brasiliensis]|uniref:Uncharacterized protein n=1 Tax=Nocardia brasiliensis (strain ATCC 700358 / HUJEG-1) TaxID=1133849 RepID=K0F380_NOCB7|nr:hypothetical protein O3I_028205 [Nocardia brasiliensis ATCC 700358]OCF89658.1 hypothetical protein AW168_15005 [Nocardia brasiliensis]